MRKQLKLTFVIISSFLTISLVPFLIYPLIEKITYVEMLKEDFLWIVYIGPMYALIESIFYFGVNLIIIFFLFIGIVLPIVHIYKCKKIFPWICISLFIYCVYLILGITFFGIRNGEH